MSQMACSRRDWPPETWEMAEHSMAVVEMCLACHASKEAQVPTWASSYLLVLLEPLGWLVCAFGT